MSLRMVLAGCAAVGLVGVAVPLPALADPPSGGDKQCAPGQNGSPKPGHKGGSCDNK